jgi:signal transduction histidine kinase/FixJ family two-component response regulator
LRLLVVDDDEIDRMSVRRALAGIQPPPLLVEREDGESALLELTKGSFDCVLLDVRLPGISGTEVLARIRNLPVRVPVVMLTGFGDEEMAVACMKAGASDYLAKGALSSERLLSSVRQALRIHEAEERAREAMLELREQAEQLRLLAAIAPELNALVSREEPATGGARKGSALEDDLRLKVAQAAREILGVETAVAVTLSEGDGAHATIVDSNVQVRELPGPLPDTLHPQRTARPSPELPRLLGLETQLRGWLLMPLLGPSLELLGAVHVTGKRLGEFGARDEHALSQLAHLAATALVSARLLRRATSATRMRDEMIAVVSHDLRNPLSAIIWSTRLLLRTLPQEAHEKLQRIDRSAEHMRALINDLLDMTRIEGGQLRLELQTVTSKSLVEDALEPLRSLASAKQIELVVDAADAQVRCDPTRLRQVFGNLVGNAVKFTPAGGHIRVRTEGRPRSVVFSVADDGPGIPSAQLPHVFERYWQAAETATQGAGLGLFIAKGIVEAHGGDIHVDSIPGTGSTFSFTIPA